MFYFSLFSVLPWYDLIAMGFGGVKFKVPGVPGSISKGSSLLLLPALLAWCLMPATALEVVTGWDANATLPPFLFSWFWIRYLDSDPSLQEYKTTNAGRSNKLLIGRAKYVGEKSLIYLKGIKSMSYRESKDIVRCRVIGAEVPSKTTSGTVIFSDDFSANLSKYLLKSWAWGRFRLS